MEARAGIAIALLLVGCTQSQVSDGNTEPIVAVSPTIAARPARQQWNTPRRLKLQLTLDRTEDLKVKVGDWVEKGQVLSDRPSARVKLIQEREILRQQLKQIQNQTVTPSHAVEQAEVEQARLKVEQARVAIANFRANSPWTDYAHQVLPLEKNNRLHQLEAQYYEAQGELTLAIAKLQAAKQNQNTKRDTSSQQAELLSKLQTIEMKLTTLGMVKAPYAGWIKSVKWLEQANQELQAEVTLALD